MSSRRGRSIGISGRGVRREGYKADIGISECERIRDRATILEPDRFSEGIDFVMVNGIFTIDGGEFTGELPGVVIKKETGKPVS